MVRREIGFMCLCWMLLRHYGKEGAEINAALRSTELFPALGQVDGN